MKIWALLCSLLFATSLGAMQEIHSIDEISVDEGALLVLDIDNVLIIPDHPAFQIANWSEHEEIVHGYYYGLERLEQEALMMLMITENPLLLIESHAPEWIASVTRRGIPVMACTAAWTANGFDQERFSTLKALGIEFRGHKEWVKERLFTEFPQIGGTHPLYRDGILFTNGKSASKGELLTTFFEANMYRPRKVIFVDDYRDNLESVGAAMEQMGIECDLYHYLGATRFETRAIAKEEMEKSWSTYAERAKEIAP